MASRIAALLILCAGILLGVFIYTTEVAPSRFQFKLGLDLAGGTLLTYKADLASVPEDEHDDAMSTLRDVIERRVNVFGVSEPVVQTQTAPIEGGTEKRLTVELPGITDVDAAVRALGETPVLEFKLASLSYDTLGVATTTFTETGLTGRFLESAQLQFGPSGPAGVVTEPIVALTFDDEGTKLFADITAAHIGEVLAIFLDGTPISAPVIQSSIVDGQAIITGVTDAEEARDLVRNLNFGALPVPINLVGAESIGPTLGAAVVRAGVLAGIGGLIIIALFMILWYRVPGLIATLGLLLYTVIVLALFKVMHITLTASGIAGFILSVGMAVDANVLIFERMKEEVRAGKDMKEAIKEGFARAWFSIRDGNLTAIFTAIILFYTTTSLIKGFALTLILGVAVSMLTAISVTRTFLTAVAPTNVTPKVRFLFGSGISR